MRFTTGKSQEMYKHDRISGLERHLHIPRKVGESICAGVGTRSDFYRLEPDSAH